MAPTVPQLAPDVPTPTFGRGAAPKRPALLPSTRTVLDVPEIAADTSDRGIDMRLGLARERTRALLFGVAPEATVIDRFTLLACIGSGGMGTVFAAYDPRLDRKIALKLLRDDVDVGTADGRERQGRLLREARAMAKLSHPNVGAVHDVGACTPPGSNAPLVWIAMEFIDGLGLRQWCQRERPNAAAIIDAYAQMGRGLAAAHAAGLVHRDVKPDNAMRDSSGRVRVLDFGVARPAVDGSERVPIDLASLATIDVESFTQTGALVGTPAYMAPEQFDGEVADARTDQYAFCLALFEALWHVRPHSGDSIHALAVARRNGRLVEATRRRDVPAAIRPIVLRGLATDPAQRWPSMDALLQALDRVRAPRRSLLLGAGATVLALGGAIALATISPRDCDEAGDAVGTVWDDDARARLRTTFASDSRAFVPATAARVVGMLDGYTGELRDAYHDACVATHETRVQSTALLDQRSACLDVRRTRLAALVSLLHDADEAVIEHATVAAESLEPIAPCSDAAALVAVAAPEPAVASSVRAIEEALASAAAARSAGRVTDARMFATGALEEAQRARYRPVLARAHLELALACDALGDADAAMAHATEAHFIGGATEQHALAARAAAVAANAQLPASANVAVAQLWHRAGLGAADRISDGEVSRAAVDVAYGTYLLRLSDIVGAREPLQRGLEVQRRRLGPDATAVRETELEFARVLVGLERIDEAHALADAVRNDAEQRLTDDLPRLAGVLGRVAELYQNTGDMTAAAPVARRALALSEANLGPDHPNTNAIRVDLATLDYRAGRRQEAVALVEVAVESTARRTDASGHARALHYYAIALKGLDRLDEALDAQTRSLAWYREHTPDSPILLLNAELTLGNIQLLRDDYPAAETAYLAALELVERYRITDRRWPVLSDYANFLFQTDRAAQAVVRLESMLAEMRAAGSPAYELAQYEFDLARALWREGRDRARARAIATSVLHVLRTESPTRQVGGHIRRDWTAEEIAPWFDDPDLWETT